MQLFRKSPHSLLVQYTQASHYSKLGKCVQGNWVSVPRDVTVTVYCTRAEEKNGKKIIRKGMRARPTVRNRGCKSHLHECTLFCSLRPQRAAGQRSRCQNKWKKHAGTKFSEF